MEEIKFTNYPEGYQKAAESLMFIPQDERETFLDALINILINQ